MTSLRFGSRTFDVSNEDKVLFPDDGTTKGDLIDYYRKVKDWILPHLKDRPLSLQRFPDGIGKNGFYQKEAQDWFPDWIPLVRVHTAGGSQEQVMCQNEATLAWLANQACITLHPWLSRQDRLEHPDLLVFDLDPPEDGFEPVRSAAFRVRVILEELGLVPFVKTTGSKGLHVAVPLDRGEDYDAVRGFARDVAWLLAQRHPGELTVEQRKNKRRGRLFLDTGRNAYGQHAVAAYSVRAKAGAPVSAPLEWDEVGRKDVDARRYHIRNIVRRLTRKGDPWADIRRRARSLHGARDRLARKLDEEERKK